MTADTAAAPDVRIGTRLAFIASLAFAAVGLVWGFVLPLPLPTRTSAPTPPAPRTPPAAIIAHAPHAPVAKPLVRPAAAARPAVAPIVPPARMPGIMSPSRSAKLQLSATPRRRTR